MKKATSDPSLVDALSLEDLCRFCQADAAWIIELVEEGVLEPRGRTMRHWRFEGISIARARRARRLHRDLGIAGPGLAVVLELLEERDAMRRRLARYEDV